LGIGCNAGLGIVYQILEFYASLHFINSDGSYNVHTVVEYVTEILKKHGLKNENIIQRFEGFIIYPTEYFCPFTLKDYSLTITANTHSIHHFAGSWTSENEKKWKAFRLKTIKRFGYKLGKLIAFGYFFFLCILSRDMKLFIKTLREKFE
jgi:GT2 family glycosyltransferase